MFLYAGGDSFTYGAEIKEDPETRQCLDNDHRIKHAWPNQLAQKLNFDEHLNDGEGGSSNAAIYRKAIRFVSQWVLDGKNPNDLFVAIGWSSADRTEFFIYEDFMQYLPSFDEAPSYKLFPQELRDFLHLYRKYGNQERLDGIILVNHIIGLQTFLKYYNVKYVFFSAFLHAKIDFEENESLIKLIDQERFYRFDVWSEPDEKKHDATMFGYINSKGYPLLSGGHPAEEGHEGWAEELASYIRKNNLL